MMYELHTFLEEALIITSFAFSISVLVIAYSAWSFFRQRIKLLKREVDSEE